MYFKTNNRLLPVVFLLIISNITWNSLTIILSDISFILLVFMTKVNCIYETNNNFCLFVCRLWSTWHIAGWSWWVVVYRGSSSASYGSLSSNTSKISSGTLCSTSLSSCLVSSMSSTWTRWCSGVPGSQCSVFCIC